LTPAAQNALIALRFRKIAATNATTSHAIALALRELPVKPRTPEPRVGAFHIMPGVPLSLRTVGENSVVFAFDRIDVIPGSEPSTTAALLIKRVGALGAETLTPDQEGRIRLPASDGFLEVQSPVEGMLDVRAAVPAQIFAPARVRPDRLDAAQALDVSADRLRTVRIGVRTAGTGTPPLGKIRVTLTHGKRISQQILTGVVEPNVYEHYESEGGKVSTPSVAPFYGYVTLFDGDHARIDRVPGEGFADLTLAELDPKAPARPVPAFALADLAATIEVWNPAKAPPAWTGFLPRKADNDAVFSVRPNLVVAEHLLPDIPAPLIIEPGTPVPKGTKIEPPFLVSLPQGVKTRIIKGRPYVSSEVPIKLTTRGDAVVLGIRAYAEEACTIVAVVDGDHFQRVSRVHQRLTTARTFDVVKGEVRSAFIFGEELAPGPHTLTFQAPPGKTVWLHLPWRSAPAAHWNGGDIE
jgi:hypothetical protein